MRSIINRFKKFGRENRTKGHRPRKLTPNQVELIKCYVDEDCTRTLETIKDFILSQFNIELSTTSVHRYLSTLHYSLKRISPIPVRRNCQSTIEERFRYALKFSEIDGMRNRVFFLTSVELVFMLGLIMGEQRKVREPI